MRRRRIREIVADVLSVEEGGEARPEEVTITAGRERAPDVVRLGMVWGDVLGPSKRDALQQLLALCGWRKEWPVLDEGERFVLREWDHNTETYSGRSVRVVVTFVLGAPFAPEGNVILSIDPAHEWVPGGRGRNGLDVCKHCGVDDAVAWYAAPAGGDRLVQCVAKGEGR